MARTPNKKKAKARRSSRDDQQAESQSIPVPSKPMGQVLADRTAEWTLQRLVPWASEDVECVSKAVMKELLAAMAPRDPLERMLVAQLAYTHERIGRLSRIAVATSPMEDAQVAHECCERAMNTYRKGMVALKEYRSKPRETPLVAVQQVNNAAEARHRVEAVSVGNPAKAIPAEHFAEAVPPEDKKKKKRRTN
ncbi:MAG: hypothetical protein ACE5E5_14280 [Phycisphaerae bacterium]